MNFNWIGAAAMCSLLVSGSVLADAKADLMSSHTAMLKGIPFRAEMSTTDKKNRTTKSTVEAQWPNKFHMMMPEQKMEVIILPGTTYMKNDGQWTKLPISMDAMTKAWSPDLMKQQYAATTNVKFEGLQDLNGKKVKVYSYDVSGKIMGIKTESHSTTYLDVLTNLPVRVVTDGTAMKQSSHTVIDYTFDPSIRIVAPN